MQVLEIKALEDYLIAKNKSYAVWGLSKKYNYQIKDIL